MPLTGWPLVTDDDGSKTFGTIFNKALTDAIRASIEADLFGALDPSRSPGDIADEVITARGSLGSLDARLDVALNEDGTPKSVAGQAINADVQAILVSRNVAVNGNLEDWSLGGALAPDNYTLSGAGATIARTGPAMGDTFTFGAGTYAAKVSRVGNNAKLLQSVISAAEMPAAAEVKGRKFAVLVKCKTGLANYLRIIVDDGVTTTASTFHTGGGTVEDLTVLHPISSTATKLEVYASFESSNGDGYVGGFTFVFSNLVPSDWTPLDTTPTASATRAGTVGLGAQQFGTGAKTFDPAAPPIGVDGYTRITADSTKNNSTTFGDVTGASFAVAANAEYEFEFVLKVIGTGAAASKYQLTGPAAPTGIIYVLLGAGSGVTQAAVAFSTAVLKNHSSTGEEAAMIKGHLRNGANAGTVQLQFAQQALEVSNLIVRAESYIIVRRRI